MASCVPYDAGEVMPQFVKAEGSVLDGTTAPVQLFGLSVSHDYFSTLKIPVVRGRGFGPEDGPKTERVSIINETMARRAFGNADPIGRHIDWNSMSDTWSEAPMTIVGVVRDVHEIGGTDNVLPTIYMLS